RTLNVESPLRSVGLGIAPYPGRAEGREADYGERSGPVCVRNEGVICTRNPFREGLVARHVECGVADVVRVIDAKSRANHGLGIQVIGEPRAGTKLKLGRLPGGVS